MTAIFNREPMLIGLTGYAGAGKDEAAKALVGAGFVRVAFADPVREALLALDPFLPNEDGRLAGRLSLFVKLLGWNEVKKRPEVRCLLQRMGTEAGRDIHGEHCWVKLAEQKWNIAREAWRVGTYKEGSPVVVTDVRFIEEVEAIRNAGGKIYGITRKGVGPANEHSSEHQLVKVDGIITNDGTIEELHAKMLALIQPVEAA